MSTVRSFRFPVDPNLAEGSSGPDVEMLQEFLQRFGYLRIPDMTEEFTAVRTAANPPEARLSTFDTSTTNALLSYQRFHGLPPSGTLDDATVALMSRPRCGFPDIPSTDGLSSFVAQGNRWNKNRLTFGFENHSDDLPTNLCRNAIESAFKLWSDVTPLRFVETSSGARPDIRIRFVTGNHGDGSPFDGVGRVLAHAFYPPPNGGDLAGDAHFDEAETWSINIPVPPGEFDLITVAAHEFGHSLGLAHSSDASALMYPSYNGPHRFLSGDDINGIRSLYGAEGVDKIGTIGQSGWPGVWNSPDAALIHPINGKAYFFKGNQYQRFDFRSSPEKVDKVGTIGQHGWPGVWSNLHAALIHPNNSKAYFFKGNQYQRFDFNSSPEKVDKVGTIGQSGWPGVWVNLHAALIHPRNGKAYFFKGNQYQRFDFARPEHVDKVGTTGRSGWPGVWRDVQSALIHPINGRAYFFKGSQYQRFEFVSP